MTLIQTFFTSSECDIPMIVNLLRIVFTSAGNTNDIRSQNAWPYPKAQRLINGMKPVEDPAGKIVVDGKKYKMQRYFIESRVFVAPRHYLFPIMQDELQKTPTLKQNPGW